MHNVGMTLLTGPFAFDVSKKKKKAPFTHPCTWASIPKRPKPRQKKKKET